MPTLSQVRERILQGDLLSDAELDSRISEFRQQTPGEDGDGFIRWLVDRQLLTDFQAEALSAGIAGPFMLGPYRVERHLTAGRLGHVFRGHHIEFNIPVSLKVFPPAVTADPQQKARMEREARVAIQLDHPNLIRTFQIGRVGDVHYLALEDLPRESLLARLERAGRLRYPEACRLVRQAALGLEYLHQNGIVHRDVSPANMWITPSERLKLIEFGSAKDELSFLDAAADGGELATAAGSVGTREYMAPEQARDLQSADPRSDLYALGCTLFQALTGRHPFADTDPAKLAEAHATAAPPMVDLLVPEVPKALADVVGRLLAKDPAERIQTAGEVDWALQPHIGVGATDADVAEAEWSPEYLAFVKSMNAESFTDAAPEDGASDLAPDAAEFLGWLSERYLQRA